VKVRSLGYRADLAILALEGSQITDRGDHLVIRTPGNPDYWWGNFLLLRDLRPGSGRAWLARFAAEFPGAQHIALGLDETDAGTVDRHNRIPRRFSGLWKATRTGRSLSTSRPLSTRVSPAATLGSWPRGWPRSGR
jgi:hypothetical protein